MNSIDYRVIPTDEIEINPWESANRLGIERGFDFELATECEKRLREVVCCKVSAVKIPILRLGGDSIDCGFGRFESKVLLKNLKNSEFAYVFAVTLGLGVDRLLARLEQTSPAEYFVTDALSSALAESATEKAVSLIRGSDLCRPRFSPGFGDFGIEHQHGILELLNAQRLLGITLNEACLMTPRKSVTAVMGIIPNEISRENVLQ